MARSLAGTCGIPLERERAYVGITSMVDPDGCVVIQTIHWPGPIPRDLAVTSSNERRPCGRIDMGNLVRSWVVTIGRRRRVVFWEAGRWFVAKKGCADR